MKENDRYIFAVDIGGTSVKYGILSLNGEIISKSEFPTEGEKGISNLFNNLYKVIDLSMNKYNILGIAISATGQIDHFNGKVIGGNDIIPGWIGCNVVEIINKKYGIPVIIENDVNSAAIGEKWKGNATMSDNYLCLTIGTGIGGAIIINDMLYRGCNSIAGEFGHLQLVKNGIQCQCGKKGCFERYASTKGLINLVKENTKLELTGYEIFQLDKSESKIHDLINQWIDYLTDGISMLSYIFDTNLILIGGGVTKQGNSLLSRIKESLYPKLSKISQYNLKIDFTKLGNDAGMIGASYLLITKYNLK